MKKEPKFNINTPKGPLEVYDDIILYNNREIKYDELSSVAYIVGASVLNFNYKDHRPPEGIWLLKTYLKQGNALTNFIREKIENPPVVPVEEEKPESHYVFPAEKGDMVIDTQGIQYDGQKYSYQELNRVTFIMGVNVFSIFFKDERPSVSIWQVEADIRSASNANRLINEYIKLYGGQQVHTHEEAATSSNARFRFNTGRGPVEIYDDRIAYNKKVYKYEELASATYVIGTQVFTLTFKDKRPPELIWLIRVDIKTGREVNEFMQQKINS